MRTSTTLTLTEIARRARLSTDEVRRYNPALTRRVPAGASLYLPRHIAALGRDIAFWHRPPSRAYASLLDEFVRLDISPDEWDSATFDRVLDGFRTRFAATRTEEGTIMAMALAYAMQDRRTSRQAEILADFRSSDEIRQLFERAQQEREAFLAQGATPSVNN
jgi:hypothetical protein